jgi:hypothetical protein
MGTTKERFLSSVIFALGIAGLFSAASAFGAAVVQDLKGDVRIGATPARSKPVALKQRVLSGNLVTTARGSQVVLRFDDGEIVALHENTRFRIVDFHYQSQDPTADRAVFALLRGAMRAVTGALGERSRNAFSLQTPMATIAIRGTDFMVAAGTPTYFSVLKGAIAATNAAGTAAFSAGAFGSIATSATLAASIPAGTLPGAVSSAFNSLAALSVAPARQPAADKTDRPVAAPPGAEAFGQDTADRVRELQNDLGREFGNEVSNAARETAQDRIPNIPSKSGRP